MDDFSAHSKRQPLRNTLNDECSDYSTRVSFLYMMSCSSLSKVFPFCIVIDSEMRISQLGPRLQSLFNPDNCVVGRHISDVFTLLRPDILHIEWEKVCASLFCLVLAPIGQSSLFHFQFLNYGKSVVFVMESCIPLKTGLTKTVANKVLKEQNTNVGKSSSVNVGAIRLKGQMKYIPSWHKLAFLCHPM
jgi:hypothetical protein